MATQDDARHRSMHMGLLLLCVGFAFWSFAGLDQFAMIWSDYASWVWCLPFYMIVHLVLAVMIMRTTGLRLWSSLFCLAGLVIGERFVPPMLFMLTIWTVRGFV